MIAMLRILSMTLIARRVQSRRAACRRWWATGTAACEERGICMRLPPASTRAGPETKTAGQRPDLPFCWWKWLLDHLRQRLADRVFGVDEAKAVEVRISLA